MVSRITRRENASKRVTFDAWRADVDDIGYSGAWAVLDAQWFGVPQRRRRVFFVGRAGADWRGPAAVLLEPDRVCGHPPARGEAREDVADTIGACAARSFGGNNTAGLIDVATAVDAKGGRRYDFASETPIMATADVNQMTSRENRSRPNPERAHTLPAAPNAPIVYPMMAPLVAGPVTATYANTISRAGNNAGALDNHVITQMGVRRLTPLECERLQGLPDDYTAITYRGEPAADAPRYKAIGNSMTVPVMRWILERLERVDALTA
jgi:DNA (cytosine-5)-methyltransferase 1